jgi:2-dehydro-3-deoxyphosphogluconate aldolase/(4S)-4-hydroxy-2-oxoglutarate aldolase
MIPAGLIAVVRASSMLECRTIVTGLADAGVTTIEITMTVPGALEIVRDLHDSSSTIGVGTVLDSATCRLAIEAGAQFIVAPVTDSSVLAVAHELGIEYVGGALTPNEIFLALQLGVDAIKIFPIGSVGGPAYLKAILEPFPGLRTVVSGGIAVADMAAYRAAGAHSICLGGAIVDRDAARAGDIEKVRRHASLVVAQFQES